MTAIANAGSDEVDFDLLRQLCTDTDGQWLVKVRAALVALAEHEEPDLRQAAEYWLGALGAWILTRDLQRAAQFFALGMDHWLAVAGAVPTTSNALENAVLQGIGSVFHNARLALRGDEEATAAMHRGIDDVERHVRALRISG